MFRRHFTLRLLVLRFSLWKLLIINALILGLAGLTKAQTSAPKAASGAKTSASKTTATKSGTAARKKGKRSTRRGSWKRKGQQVINPERATEIQEALIREKYLTGQPSGKWDARTQAAMTRYQADNGWQSKVTPDSRALIKLGLGPNYSEQIINGTPKSGAVAANTTGGTSTTAAPKR